MGAMTGLSVTLVPGLDKLGQAAAATDWETLEVLGKGSGLVTGVLGIGCCGGRAVEGDPTPDPLAPSALMLMPALASSACKQKLHELAQVGWSNQKG